MHPYISIKKIKKLLKKYKVEKFRTSENIYNAEIVVFSDSSSIVDAFILKKKMLCIKKITTPINTYVFLKNYHNQGLVEINLDKNFQYNKKIMDKKLIKSINNYDKFNKKFTQVDKSNLGNEKVINYIKNLLFKN